MTRRTRRNHSGAFKATAAIKGDQTLAELALAPDVHVNQITQWRTELLEGAARVFDYRTPEANAPVPDLKALHAKIGELTLENDFLEGALINAGMLKHRE